MTIPYMEIMGVDRPWHTWTINSWKVVDHWPWVTFTNLLPALYLLGTDTPKWRLPPKKLILQKCTFHQFFSTILQVQTLIRNHDMKHSGNAEKIQNISCNSCHWVDVERILTIPTTYLTNKMCEYVMLRDVSCSENNIFTNDTSISSGMKWTTQIISRNTS